MAGLPIYSGLDLLNRGKIVNSPSGTGSGDLATYGQLTSAIEGLKNKDPVVVATQVNLSIAAPGATIDGVTMVAGDRFLAKAQTTSSQNGIYIWNGEGNPMQYDNSITLAKVYYILNGTTNKSAAYNGVFILGPGQTKPTQGLTDQHKSKV